MALLLVTPAWGQEHTHPSGSSLPATCRVGSVFILTTGGAGQKAYLCETTNTWVLSAGTPGGSNTQCQFNDSGVFGGDSGCTFNKTTDTLTVGSVTTSGATSNSTFTGTINYCEDAGANDTYTCSISPAPSQYTTGAVYMFKANTANTGAATINFNSLGAKTIKKAAGGITTDLSDNDIRASQVVIVQYDGTNMMMQSLLGNTPSGAISTNRVHLKKSSAQTLTTATETAITFQTETYDDGGLHAANDSKITAPTTGVYVITCSLLFDADNNGVWRMAILKVNGSTEIARSNISVIGTTGYPIPSVTATYKLTATDYVQCIGYHDKGSNLDVKGTDLFEGTTFSAAQVQN